MSDLDPLRRVIAGEVIEPGDRGYEAAYRPALARFRHIRPRAVVRCVRADDVASAIEFARESGLPVAPRGGGHCFAGRSSTDGILLDLTPMRSVTVTPDALATIGAGTRLADMYDALDRYGLSLPAGCGAGVGIAGLTLGGGLGLLGRRYGLTCDRLRAARVVLTDGRILDCADDRHRDLFWALRGAGGGQFGVVTSLVFEAVPAHRASRFVLTWRPPASASASADVVGAWQEWAPEAPDEVSANLKVVAAGAGAPVHVIMFGAVLDTPDAACGLLRQLVALCGVPPSSTSVTGMGYRSLKRSLDRLGPQPSPTGNGQELAGGGLELAGNGLELAGNGPEPAGGGPEPAGQPASKSEFIGRPLPADVITDLLAALAGDRVAGEHRELNFTPMGGAYNRVPSEATAFAHRAERFLLEHVATRAGDQMAAAAWVGRSYAIAHPWASGRVYPNFPDPDLPDWASAYHGGNHARLAGLKRAYDPHRVLRFHQSL